MRFPLVSRFLAVDLARESLDDALKAVYLLMDNELKSFSRSLSAPGIGLFSTAINPE
jgi:hypothetical protein